MAYSSHQSESEAISARCAIVTLSDTRTLDSDHSGKTARRLLEAAGHTIVDYRLIRDEPTSLQAVLDEFLVRPDVDVILTNGGTGISRRDQTVPVIQSRIEVELPGFGELFRMLSFEQIQSGAMLSRAIGGISCGKLLFALPGSTNAVELALTRLIVPELAHLLHQLKK